LLQKIARALTRKPKLIAIIAVLLLIPSLLGYVATKINYDILTYLPDDLESTEGEKLLEEPFEDAATSMLIVENMPAAYTNSLLEEIKDVPGVSNAVWVSNLVGIQIPTDFIPANMRDVFYSGDSTMMIIQYEKPAASEVTMDAIEQIRSLCNEKCFLAGFSVVAKDTRDLVNEELPVYVGLAVALSLVAMLLTLESSVLPFVFLLSIGMAILYNFGTNIFLGQISYLTKAIAAILQLGVTMDYSIFLYRRYVEELSNYDDKRDAMAQAIVAAFQSLTGSSLTTIAGFVALCFMQLTLGKDIGIVMAKGVALGVLTVIFVLPAMLLLFDKPIRRHVHKTIIPSFSRVNAFMLSHRKFIVVLFLLLFIPSLYAENHTSVYYKLDRSLPDDMPSIVANNKLKTEYNMATSHFIVLDDDISNSDMNEMETAIKNVDGVTSVISYHSLVGDGIPDFFIPEDVRDILKQGGYQLMMVNSKYSAATDQVSQQLDSLEGIVKNYDAGAYITGEAALTDDLIDTAAVDFRVTNYISIAAIFVIIAIVFQSLTIPVVLVLAIELAIFINQGIPYFMGTTIPFISPTIIGCVQLGATVDYAILMSTRFREELRNGHDRHEAAKIAADTSDASIITSALVMFSATFGVSVISQIEIVSSICTMLARGAIISAIMIIFVLPSILCVCEPVFNKTSFHWRVAPPPRESRIVNKISARRADRIASSGTDAQSGDVSGSSGENGSGDAEKDGGAEKSSGAADDGQPVK
jgi:predicted RND superfamily exporter protein